VRGRCRNCQSTMLTPPFEVRLR